MARGLSGRGRLALIGTAVAVAGAAVLAALTAGGDTDGGDRVRVAAALYPLAEAAAQIGGDRVAVTDLTPVGGAPYDLQLSAAASGVLRRSSVVLYLGGGFQPTVERTVRTLPASVRAVDLLDGQQLIGAPEPVPGTRDPAAPPRAAGGDRDPHVWVDPARFVRMTERVTAALSAADPGGRDDYEANAKRYIAQLGALDARFDAALSGCAGATLATTNAAFGYLAERFGITQAAMPALETSGAPTDRALAAAGEYARAREVGTVFFRTAVPERLARTVTDEVGVRTGTLNPVAGLTADEIASGASYSSIQEDNLRQLTEGLRCAKA